MDMEFATDIGQNLLMECRRLQALLSDRDQAISKMVEERDGLEAEKEGLIGAVRVAEGSVGELSLLTAKDRSLMHRTIQGRELEPRSHASRRKNQIYRRPGTVQQNHRRALSSHQIPRLDSRACRGAQDRC